MTRPFSPKEIVAHKQAILPEEVFTVVNALLAQKLCNDTANLLQDEVVAALVAAGLSKDDIFKKGYLNFEDSYKANGWAVEYDKPGYNENYQANWTFASKRKRK